MREVGERVSCKYSAQERKKKKKWWELGKTSWGVGRGEIRK